MKIHCPTSVLPVILKMFENVIYAQLNEYFTRNSLLFRQQYRYRRNRSTELAVLKLMNQNINNMSENYCTINVYQDLSKTFDSLNYNVLLSKLNFYGIDQQALFLLKCYLYDRNQYVQINNIKSSYHTVLCGIPQGSVIGHYN